VRFGFLQGQTQRDAQLLGLPDRHLYLVDQFSGGVDQLSQGPLRRYHSFRQRDYLGRNFLLDRFGASFLSEPISVTGPASSTAPPHSPCARSIALGNNGVLVAALWAMQLRWFVAYRLSVRNLQDEIGQPVTNADGEVPRGFIQGKSELRHGERITMFHTMKDRHLDQLAVAG
jgi:hypothetical protein